MKGLIRVHLHDADRLAACCPHPIEVDTGRHDHDEHIRGAAFGNGQLFDLHRVDGVAFPIGPNHHSLHVLGNGAQRGS